MRDLLNISHTTICRVCGARTLSPGLDPACKLCKSLDQKALASVSQMPWDFRQLELDMWQAPDSLGSARVHVQDIDHATKPCDDLPVCRACERGIESLEFPGTCHSCGIEFPAGNEAHANWLALPERRSACCNCRCFSVSRMPDGRLKCYDCDTDQNVSEPHIGKPQTVLFGRAIPQQSQSGHPILEHQKNKEPKSEAWEQTIKPGHGEATRSWIKAVQEAAADEPGRPEFEVFRQDQLDAADTLIETHSGDADHKLRIKTTIRQLFLSGSHRPLATPGAGWQAQIETLAQEFPNFAQAIEEVIAPSLAIAAAGGLVRPAPLLLVGPPGIGKSYFSQRLAQMLQVPHYHVDMASASMGATLGGLGVHWSTSGPGIVFRALAFGQDWQGAVANPLIVLDEIDKVRPDHRYDPLAPLYALLEPQTAKRFADESLPGIAMNASCIRWLLCANDTAPIPKPILSRVHIVHVPELAPGDRRAIFQRIFARVVSETGLDGFNKTAPDLVFSMADSMGPREFGKRSAMAVGRALAGNRWKVTADDFSVIASAAHDRPIGFV